MSRLVFLGTPDAAVPSLRALVDAGHQVEQVVTRRDTRRSRRGDPEPSPVKKVALDLGLEVTDKLDDVLGANAELGVVVAYGRIIPESVLEVLPMVNVHFSLLPRWRGAAPVERAILAGDATTGVCVMRLEAGLDTGPVLARSEVPIGPEETADELKQRLSVAGANLLAEVLSVAVSELPEGETQQGEATYAAKIEPRGARAAFRSSRDRACSACPGWKSLDDLQRGEADRRDSHAHPAHSGARSGELPGSLDGTSVVTGDGTLELVEVQPEGRRRVPAGEWLRGARPQKGELLGA